MTKKTLIFSLIIILLLLSACTQKTVVKPPTNVKPINLEPTTPTPVVHNEICGPDIKGPNHKQEYCNTSCEKDTDCQFTCGCGAINNDETCDDEGFIYDCVDQFVECAMNKCSVYTIVPNCADGVTIMSYYPNPNGDITFESDMAPSQELIDIRVAYSTQFACSESAKEGYFIKKDGEFIKVTQGEFERFNERYNAECNNCLTEHFDGCC